MSNKTGSSLMVRVIHWMKSASGLNPFEGVSYKTSSNTGGCGSSSRVRGVWVVPAGKGLNQMWCRSSITGQELFPARDIQVVAEVPLARLNLFVGGKKKDFSSWTDRGAEAAVSLAAARCRDEDNGLVIDKILPEEIVEVSFGEYVPTGEKDSWGNSVEKVVLTPLDESFFSA